MLDSSSIGWTPPANAVSSRSWSIAARRSTADRRFNRIRHLPPGAGRLAMTPRYAPGDASTHGTRAGEINAARGGNAVR